MILCLDVGNTQLFGGVFHRGQMKLSFRKASKTGASSDELGVFLRSALRENAVDPSSIERIAFCSVVPEIVHSLLNCCTKYFGLTPFVLEPGVKTGLKVRYRNPLEVGTDRIANAIAAVERYPGKDLVIVDFGTATTFDAVTAKKDYLGGVICAGLRISMEALEMRTSRLPSVEIRRPEAVVGRSTVESIQSGLYFGHLGMTRALVSLIGKECFEGSRPMVIGTGGLSRLFEDADVFDVIHPDLVLTGLLHALHMNT